MTDRRARRAAAAILLPAILVVTACGSDDDGSAGGSTSAAIDATDTTDAATGTTDATGDDATSTDAVDGAIATEEPTVDDLPDTPVTELAVTELRAGEGSAAAAGDTVVIDYVGVRSIDGTRFDSSYDYGTPIGIGPLGEASVIDGFNEGLVGVQAGQMVQLDIPNEMAYGDTAQGDIIQAGDDLTFVVEVRAIVEATSVDQQPDVTVQPSTGSTEIKLVDLVDGDGDEAQIGDGVAVQYMAFDGGDGTMIDSGWSRNLPITLTLGSGQYIYGFEEGIEGMRVGGRRQVTVPTELAFGSTDSADTGVADGADLIMVFDLLATY